MPTKPLTLAEALDRCANGERITITRAQRDAFLAEATPEQRDDLRPLLRMNDLYVEDR